ncbi:conserved hypothetical protein (plasmid) [Borreliella burgdorferi 64b]|nr:conserved hypothetical protein [Borreliella burgdorferi 64b]
MIFGLSLLRKHIFSNYKLNLFISLKTKKGFKICIQVLNLRYFLVVINFYIKF